MQTLTLRRLALAAPFVFLAHVAEEAPGFVAWFNSLVSRGISQRSFLYVNAVAFVITVLLAALVVASPQPASGLAFGAWVGFLMLANGLFHLLGTVVHSRYSPGVVTGVVFYLPFGCLVLRALVRELSLKPSLVILVSALGALPMLVHGYRIVFQGSRLF